MQSVLPLPWKEASAVNAVAYATKYHSEWFWRGVTEARVVTDVEWLGEATHLTCRGGPLVALFMAFQALDVGPSPTPRGA